MKKGLLLFVCAISLATITQAQVRFGFKAGANLANITGDVGDTKMKFGFNVGAIAKISVSESFSVQPELVYSSQGAKAEEGDGAIKLSYINLPIMAQYNTGGFILEAGPQFGFLMSAKADDGDDETDIKDGLKGLDLGLGFGAGYQTESGFGVNARFNLGLSNMVDDGGDDFKWKNSVIQVGVFYLLGGGGSAKK